MKKQALIYLSGLVFSTIVGGVVGYSIRNKPKKSGTLNVFYDETNTPSMSLAFKTNDDVNEMLKHKTATFDIKFIKIEEEKDK